MIMAGVYKKKNAGQLTDNINEPEDLEKEAVSEKRKSDKRSKKYPWKRKAILLFVWGSVVFVAFLSYPFVKSRRINPLISTKNLKSGSVMSQVKRFPIQNNRLLSFQSFIIPFEERGKFTYITLSISFELPNKELMDEMIEKNTRIRGIIYSILDKNINILKNISSLEKLKELIAHHVNSVLTAGKVHEPIITDFSTV
jgi:flagellar basal body-associated protein FliL